MMKQHAGFSLIELMVATALGMMVIMMVSFAFTNSTKATQRSMAIVELSSQAQAVIGLLERDLLAIQPSCAMNAAPTSFTFAKSQSDPMNGTAVNMSYAAPAAPATDPMYGDLVWVQWDWTNATGKTGSGPLIRAMGVDSSNRPNYQYHPLVAVNTPASAPALQTPPLTTSTALVRVAVLPTMLNFKMTFYSSRDIQTSNKIVLGAVTTYNGNSFNGTAAAANIRPRAVRFSFILTNANNAEVKDILNVAPATPSDDDFLNLIRAKGRVGQLYEHAVELPDA